MGLLLDSWKQIELHVFKIMNVGEVIEKLKQFDPEMEVIISDGWDFKFYHMNGAVIQEFEGKVDIGIGGCEEEIENN